MNLNVKSLRSSLQSARASLGNALIVTRREVSDSLRDWRILSPIIIMTLIFPALAQLAADKFMAFVQGHGARLIGERTIPFLLMVVGFFPISISMVIALETFVGEKERRSLEPLLATPLTNTELYIGKTLAAMIPPLVASYSGMAVYLVGLRFGELRWWPGTELLVQIVLLTTAQALVMVSAAVVISSQTTSVRAANLLASFIVVPAALLVQLESVIMFFAAYDALWSIFVGLLVAAVLLVRMGAHIFNREELLGRELDVINVAWAWEIFWGHFRGEGRFDLWGWWRREVLGAAGKLWKPAIAIVLCLIAGFGVGWSYAQDPAFHIPLDEMDTDTWLDNFVMVYELAGGGSSLIPLIIWQNLRVLLVGLVLAVFTFGVGAAVIVMAPLMILGFILAQFVNTGVSPVIFLAAVLPHSVIEIPAAVIASAAALRLGAVLIRPPRGQTVGEAWLVALAETLQVWIGLVLPMLMVSAMIEAWITPRVVMIALGG